MYSIKTIVTLGVVVLAVATTAQYHGHEEFGHKELDHHYEHHEPAHYSFEYKVHDPHTGDIKSQRESREGDNVKGYYMLHEADGTTREVHYTADHHNGFNAIVQKSGHPVFNSYEGHH